ncbi:hypothetical protein XENOCAPTIV_025395, partial [Xenoophorus captivus]
SSPLSCINLYISPSLLLRFTSERESTSPTSCTSLPLCACAVKNYNFLAPPQSPPTSHKANGVWSEGGAVIKHSQWREKRSTSPHTAVCHPQTVQSDLDMMRALQTPTWGAFSEEESCDRD